MELINILKKGRVFGIIGSKHTGKTTALINFIDSVKSYPNKYAFCYHQETKELLNTKFRDLGSISNLNELEQIQNSFVFIDEFHNLFNLNDRHQVEIIKSVFNQIQHNNNIVILCGTPEYYNKLICSFIDEYILCKIKDFNEFVQGSHIKRYVLNLGTNLKGGTCFNVPVNKIFFKGELVGINYNKKTDKKTDRVDLFEGL